MPIDKNVPHVLVCQNAPSFVDLPSFVAIGNNAYRVTFYGQPCRTFKYLNSIEQQEYYLTVNYFYLACQQKQISRPNNYGKSEHF